MSKKSLKKELDQLTREQLSQIILDLYDARREAKEYLEFFLHPNVDKVLAQQLALVEKEMRRQKWGRSRGRVTNIKKAVTELITLKPGDEVVLEMLFKTIFIIGKADRVVELTESQEKLAGNLTNQIIDVSNSAGLASLALNTFNSFIQNEQYSLRFRRLVSQAIENYQPGKKK